MADARADKGNLFALDEVCKLLLFLLHKKDLLYKCILP